MNIAIDLGDAIARAQTGVAGLTASVSGMIHPQFTSASVRERDQADIEELLSFKVQSADLDKWLRSKGCCEVGNIPDLGEYQSESKSLDDIKNKSAITEKNVIKAAAGGGAIGAASGAAVGSFMFPGAGTYVGAKLGLTFGGVIGSIATRVGRPGKDIYRPDHFSDEAGNELLPTRLATYCSMLDEALKINNIEKTNLLLHTELDEECKYKLHLVYRYGITLKYKKLLADHLSLLKDALRIQYEMLDEENNIISGRLPAANALHEHVVESIIMPNNLKSGCTLYQFQKFYFFVTNFVRNELYTFLFLQYMVN